MLRLKELRLAHEPPLSMEKLAARAGLTAKTIYRAERTGQVNAKTLEAIAEALDIPVGELFVEEASA